MSKNPYAKAVKLFSKAESLYIGMENDAVFLSDGHIILKIHVAAYDAFFRPVSGQFIQMENGEKAARRDTAQSMPEKCKSAFGVADCFRKMTETITEAVKVTPFLMEYVDRKKTYTHRILTTESAYIPINNDFFQVAAESGYTAFFSAGGSKNPVCATSGEYNGIVILPVNINQQVFEDFANRR